MILGIISNIIFITILIFVGVMVIRSFVWARQKNRGMTGTGNAVSVEQGRFKKNFKIFVFITIALAAAFAIIAQNYFNSDGYFLIATGRYILQNGFPTVNPFVLHENFRIVIQQWIVCVIDAVMYDNFGWGGLFAFSFIMEIVVAFLTWKIVRMFYPDRENMCIICTVIVAFTTTGIFASCRPFMLFATMMLLELLCLEKYKRDGKMRYLVALIPVSVLLVNIQASMWLFFFCLILAYVFIDFKKIGIKYNGYKRKNILLMTPFYALAGLINPYGWRNALYLLIGYSTNLQIVDEMQSPQMFEPVGLIIIGITAFIIILIFNRYRKERHVEFDSAHLYLFLGTLLLSVISKRGLLMLIVCALFLILDLAYPDRKEGKDKVTGKNRFDGFMNGFTYIFFMVCSVFFIIIGVEYIQGKGNNKNGTYESYKVYEKAADYLEENDELDARLYAQAGSYFEFRGCTNIYVDNRSELFTERMNGQKDVLGEIIEMNDSFTFTCEDMAEFIDSYDFDYICAVFFENIYYYCESNPDQFEKVVEDSYYALYKVLD